MVDLTDSEMAGGPAPVPAPVPSGATGVPGNNPTNVRPIPGGWFGQIGVLPNGIAAFDNIAHGWDAGDKNMVAKVAKHGLTSLNQIIGDQQWGWAPKGDGANDPTAYVGKIAPPLGVAGDDPSVGLKALSNPSFRHQILETMANQVENPGFNLTFGGGPSSGQQTSSAAGLSDADMGFNPAAALTQSAAPQGKPDFGLGFFQGITQPWQNASNWLREGYQAIPGEKAVDPAVQAALTGAKYLLPGFGMYQTPAETQAQQGVVGRAEAAGQRPGPVGSVVGQTAATLPLQALPGGPLVGGALSGAMTSSDPSNLAQVATNAVLGAGTSALAGGATKALAGAIDPLLAPAVQRLRDLGVQMTSGQLLQGVPKALEDAVNSVPGVKLMVENARNDSLISFNKAAINQTLAPIKEALPAAISAGHDAINYAADRLGKVFDSAVQGIGPAAKVDAPLTGALSDAAEVLQNAPKAIQEQFQDQLKANFGRWVQPGGTVPGAMVQRAGQMLGYLSRKYSGSSNPDQQLLGHALDAANDGISDWVGRINPQAADALSSARLGWANLVRVMGAAGRSPLESGGIFTPANLGRAVTSADNSPLAAGSHQAIAKGQGLMQQLAEDGQRVLPNKIPDSGTVLRALTSGGLLGAGGAIASHAAGGPMGLGALAGAGLAGLAYTPVAQRVLRTAIGATRPPVVKAVGSGVRALAPAAAAVGGVLGPAEARAMGLLHGLGL